MARNGITDRRYTSIAPFPPTPQYVSTDDISRTALRKSTFPSRNICPFRSKKLYICFVHTDQYRIRIARHPLPHPRTATRTSWLASRIPAAIHIVPRAYPRVGPRAQDYGIHLAKKGSVYRHVCRCLSVTAMRPISLRVAKNGSKTFAIA